MAEPPEFNLHGLIWGHTVLLQALIVQLMEFWCLDCRGRSARVRFSLSANRERIKPATRRKPLFAVHP